MTAIRDWRTLAPDEAALLYDAERRRSIRLLDWDTTRIWLAVEAARGTAALPGLIAVDEGGAIAGWTFFVLDGAMLQIGGIESASTGVTDVLVRGILGSPEAAAASRVMLFGADAAAGLGAVLAAAGFETATYSYLRAPLPPVDIPPAKWRRWRAADRAALAVLLSEAYPGADSDRPFAPSGDAVEWRRYVSQLLDTAACGTFLPAASQMASDDSGLEGAALVSHLSGTTAHLLQLAVTPRRQGRRVGRSLLASAMAAASSIGLDRMTLLVKDVNGPARRLYESLGFTPRARFISASRPNTAAASVAA